VLFTYLTKHMERPPTCGSPVGSGLTQTIGGVRFPSVFMLLRMPNGPGGNISLSCNEPGSCPREIGAGLLYSLLKSVLMTNKLYLDGPIRFAVIMLVNTFFR